jgi:hypothetical protein
VAEITVERLMVTPLPGTANTIVHNFILLIDVITVNAGGDLPWPRFKLGIQLSMRRTAARY